MTAGSGEALRQQLDQALAIARKLGGVIFTEERLLAFVAAARVATTTEIAAKIADERMNISYGDIRQDEWLAGKATGFDEAIALIGGSVPAPKGDQ